MKFPTITEIKVIPVAGFDSFLLNLSGGHGPVFIRNLVVLKDNSGNIGIGETPGGEAIRKTLEDLIKINPAFIYPCHCTGSKNVQRLIKCFGRKCKPLKTGNILEM